MADKPRVISISGLRLLAEYIRDAIVEAIDKRSIMVQYNNGVYPPVFLKDGSLYIQQAYETIQNGTVLEVK